jgi:hypothetical protein
MSNSSAFAPPVEGYPFADAADYHRKVIKMVGDAYRWPPSEEIRQAVVTARELAEAVRLQNGGQAVGIYVEPAVLLLARHFNPFRCPYPDATRAILYRRWPALVQQQHLALHAAFREIVAFLGLEGIYEGNEAATARGQGDNPGMVPEEPLARLETHAAKLGAELTELEARERPASSGPAAGEVPQYPPNPVQGAGRSFNDLKDSEKNIVQSVRKNSMKGQKIAEKVGLEYNYTRSLLSGLVRESFLTKDEDGYRANESMLD